MFSIRRWHFPDGKLTLDINGLEQGFFTASGNINSATIAHYQVAAFYTNIFCYFIQIHKVGVMHAHKKSKGGQLFLDFF